MTSQPPPPGRVPAQSGTGATGEKARVPRFPVDLIKMSLNIPLNFHFL